MDAMLSEADAARPIIAAVIEQAHVDAEAVWGFLTELGHIDERGKFRATHELFHPSLLIGLSQVLRLRRWEIQHFDLHRRAGLPMSSEAFQRLTTARSAAELQDFVNHLAPSILHLSIRHFVRPTEDCPFRTDLAVVAQEDEGLVDAIADFLLAISQQDPANFI